MNKLIPKALSVCVLTLSALATPGASPAHAWVFSSAHVAEIMVWSDGHATVRFAEFPGNTDCGSNFFSLGTADDPRQKGMLAVAEAALLSGRPVAVESVESGSDRCQGHEEKLNYISLK